MTTIGIIGAGEVGAQISRAAIAKGYSAVIAVPLKLVNDMPVEELAGKIVIDTNNYMAGRDGNFPSIDSGEKTVHELRQEQLPRSKIVAAFTHIQAPTLFRFARPAGSPDRLALAVSSNHREAAEFVAGLYDQLGYDTVDNSPLSESWRSGPGTPARHRSLLGGQGRDALVRNLDAAEPINRR